MRKSVHEFLWVALPKASGAAFQLGLNLILLRYFGPEQFGLVAVCLSIIILSDAVLGSAFDVAILRQAPLYQLNDPVRSLQIQQAGLIMKPVLGVLIAVPLVVFGSRMSALLFHGRGTTSLLYITAAAVFSLLLLRSVQAHFQVGRKFRGYGALDIGHNTVRYGGTALLLWMHVATPLRVVALYALGPGLIALVLLATIAKPLITVPVSLLAVRQIFDLIKSYLPTAAVGSITTRIDLFFVSSLLGVGQAGVFAAAQTLILAPQLVGMYMGVVFAPRIMPLFQAGELRAVYNRFQKYTMVVCCGTYLAGLAMTTKLIAVALPASFQNATPVAIILLPVGLAAVVNFPWTVSFLMFMRPQFLLKFDLVGLPILAVLYSLVVPAYGLPGAAYVTTGYALIKTIALQKVAQDILSQAKLPTGPSNLDGASSELQLAGKAS